MIFSGSSSKRLNSDFKISSSSSSKDHRKKVAIFEYLFIKSGSKVNEGLLKEFGVKLDEDNKEFEPNVYFGDEKWYLGKENREKFEKWNRIEFKHYIFNLCKSLRILDQYKLSLLANNMEEIGFYEILKKTILKSIGKFSIINFQSIRGKGSVRWCFKKFLSIDLTPMNNELIFLQDIIDKRHKIIHGFIEDDKVNKSFVEKAYDSVNKIISFLKDQIYDWYRIVP